MAAWRATGQRPAELDTPPAPRGCEALLNAFWQLHATRQGTGMGPCALSPQHVLAWQELQDVDLSGWEIDTIFALDRLAMKCMNDQAAAAT